MLAEQKAIYAAILANPSDDAPRLIYADYLEEQGQTEQAEFIRKQIELANRDDRRDHDELFIQANTLKEQFARKQRWKPRLPSGFNDAEFGRGFVDRICPSMIEDFVKQAAKLRTLVPFTHLDIGETYPTHDDLRELCQCPALRQVTKITAFMNDFDDESMRILATCPHLENLQAIDLWGNEDITGDGIASLLSSPHLGNLRDLELATISCGNEGAIALAQSPRLRQLRKLNLSATGLNDAGAIVLLQSKNLGPLKELNLDNNPLGDATALALARSKRLTTLTVLDLGHTQITAGGLGRLLRSSALPSLKTLDVINLRKTDNVAESFASSKLPNLERLLIDRFRLGKQALQTMFAKNPFPRLRTLWLTENNITSGGVIALIAEGEFEHLEVLNLCHNKITSAGIVALAQAPLCQRLKWLHIGCNQIDDEGGEALLASPWLANIPRLTLFDNTFTTRMKRRLKKHFGERADV